MKEITNVRYLTVEIVQEQRESMNGFLFDAFGFLGFCTLMLDLFIFAGIFS